MKFLDQTNQVGYKDGFCAIAEPKPSSSWKFYLRAKKCSEYKTNFFCVISSTSTTTITTTTSEGKAFQN